jgi:pyridoxamine 5'-phosphate oxidase
MNDFTQFRQEYSGKPVEIDQLATDPFIQFSKWFDDAVDAKIKEPNAMTLATADENGRPSCRVVLLKDFKPDGFTFYTNYKSRKGHEILINPHVSLLFFWGEQQRQIRIYGSVEKTNEKESDTYFFSRPLRSQVAAVISSQSSVIQSRVILEKNFETTLEKCQKEGISRPPHWGGFHVTPEEFEFWQGQADRLHDRIRYRLQDGVWIRERLSP